MTKTIVMGLGNVLMGDDGLGPYLISHLEALYNFPESVTILDAGTPGLDLIPLIMDATNLIVLDTVRGQEPPGTILRYNRAELVTSGPPDRLSPHDPAIGNTLLTLELHQSPLENVILIGAVPQLVETGTSLSPCLRAVIPELIQAVVVTLNDWGLEPLLKNPPDQPRIWWEGEIGHEIGKQY